MKFIKNLLLTATICASLSVTALATTYTVSSKFSDVTNSDWYTQYVQTAFDAGCVSGNTETTFNPTGNLTMAEFAVMLTNAYYGTELAAEMSKHNDGQWGDNYINTLKNQYSGNYASTINAIGSYESLSRYEASYIIGMMLQDKGIANTGTNYTGSLSDFTDVSGSTTETGLLGTTISHNIMSGKSSTSFDGSGTLTRAEACVIIAKLISLEKDSGLVRDTFDQSNVVAKPVVTPEPEVVAPLTPTPVAPSTPSTSTGDTITINGVTMTETEYIAYLNNQHTKPGEIGSAGVSQAAIDQGSLDVKWG